MRESWKSRVLGSSRSAAWGLLACGWMLARALGGEFSIAPSAPSMDRWVYPFGDFLGDRSVAPNFASFDPRFDTRDAQYLMGWTTDGLVVTNAGPSRYLLRRARLEVRNTVNNAFVYDPTFDPYLTYATNQPGYVADADPGRPVELYGAGFRNGFTTATFLENSPYGRINPITSGNISIGTRNAFAAMFGDQGQLVDVSNNVGQANPEWTQPPFEVRPWAVGTTTNAAPGELVPEDALFTFDIDLKDPWIVGYLQSALNEGRLRLILASLSPANQVTPGGTGGGGAGAYPQWATRENLLFAPPRLILEGVVVGPEDTDQDGLPDDWERFHFGSLDKAAADDTDQDRATELAEYQTGTDPNSPSSYLRIDSVTWDGDRNATLGFPTAPSRSYRVETSHDLQSWWPAQGGLTYPSPGRALFVEQRLTDPPMPPAQAYYRVVAE